MDGLAPPGLALARRSGQELRNSHAITGSPKFAPLRKYFSAAIHQLRILYTGVPPGCTRYIAPADPHVIVV